ncbi:MAE_28990/MAE_18760 family HEPN-like nuclease [Corynebacterium sp. CCM 9186]|uniref:MAE_28990/MAE_18760 family HEPN-like nuclease n=1 Tax=Corynebacterium meridianum TaxID=2765363 RepID=UPI002006D3DB|nr:MAE_28990/MAE_18760 family HEPN-like nuclease [Corynebacterium meridianum]MCK7678266.1 MAE_28990/MAE_18760 family HEPN-like nuclease [Corynebacterium meridianum]
MSAEDLYDLFSERKSEIDAYLDLLRSIDTESKSGVPRLGASRACKQEDDGTPITTVQVNILQSCLFLLLYNLVEAIVTRFLEEISNAIDEADISASELNFPLREEWIRSFAKTEERDLNPKSRLDIAIALCEHILEQRRIDNFKITRSGGGNWDDQAIEKYLVRIGGIGLLPEEPKAKAKHNVRDNDGALVLVRKYRNALAHGRLSFADCSEDVYYNWLENLSCTVVDYVEGLVKCCGEFIEEKYFTLHSQ